MQSVQVYVRQGLVNLSYLQLATETSLSIKNHYLYFFLSQKSAYYKWQKYDGNSDRIRNAASKLRYRPHHALKS